MLTVKRTRDLLCAPLRLVQRCIRALEPFLWEWTTNGNKRHRIPRRHH